MDDVLIVIPARMESQRFPGKPLAEANGKSLLRHTYEQASKVGCEVVVAANEADAALIDHCGEYGLSVYHTGENHWCGTARAWEVASKRPEKQVIVNWQVDEPEANFGDVVSASLTCRAAFSDAFVLTPYSALWTKGRDDPNLVKVVISNGTRCHWFSRTYMPGSYAHQGIYVFPRQTLEVCGTLPQSTLSMLESLEQLSWLDHVKVCGWMAPRPIRGINTPEDLEEFEWRLKNGRSG
jgi:3-deoxy-manno-octulosonate cytidylyltransferase (CMP-KDO synthetase)